MSIYHQSSSAAIKSLWDEVSWKFLPQFSGSLMVVWEHLKLLMPLSMSCYKISLQLLEHEVFGDEPRN